MAPVVTVAEQAAAYEASRGRIDELVRRLDEHQLATTVPCCPRWSVKDLVGHVTGVLEDRRAGRLPTDGMTGWTDAQVARHRDEPVAAVLDTWHALPVEQTDEPPSLAALSFDAVTHEHDLFQALGVAADSTSESVLVGSSRAEERMASMLEAGGAPGVLLTTEDGERLVVGVAAPIPLTATRYALMRLVTGRMSRAQAEAMSWGADPVPVLGALFADGFFTLQPDDVSDPDLR